MSKSKTENKQKETPEVSILTEEAIGIASETIDDSNKGGWRLKAFGFIFIALVAFMAFYGAHLFVSSENQRFERDLQERTEILVLERSEIFATWLNGISNQARPIVQSDVFRAFSTAIDVNNGDMSAVLEPTVSADDVEGDDFGLSYKDQLPFMINALTDLVQDSDYKAAYMVGRTGNTFLTSVDAPPLLKFQKDEALRVFDNAMIGYSPYRAVAGGIEFDVLYPITPVDISSGVSGATQIIGVFVFTVSVADKLSILLQPNPISGLKGQYRLYQKSLENSVEEIRVGASNSISQINVSGDIITSHALNFAQRAAMDNIGDVYSYGLPVKNSAFFLAWESPVSSARAALDKMTVNVYLIAIFLVFCFVTAFGAFWWRSNSDRNKSLADQYAALAKKIQRQKAILNTVNSSIEEYISMKDVHGKYSYVNPAFAKAVGRPIEEIVGLDSEALFGHGTATRLSKLDDMAMSAQKPIKTIDEIYLQGDKRHIQISKVPLTFENDSCVVTVGRDITDFVEDQERRERSVKQTVSALVNAVELRDPHLAGHSRRVNEFATAVAHDLSTDIRLKRTVEIASNLCQIGKINIPRDILTAERRLTKEEFEVMKGHVDSAISIIGDIEFDLPVAKSIAQMYERLDGSGYPNGLKDDDISLEARILAVSDYFCARIEPRSYRSAILPKDALKYLEQNADKYDPQVVSTLKKIVNSAYGEKIIASIGRDTKDI